MVSHNIVCHAKIHNGGQNDGHFQNGQHRRVHIIVISNITALTDDGVLMSMSMYKNLLNKNFTYLSKWRT